MSGAAHAVSAETATAGGTPPPDKPFDRLRLLFDVLTRARHAAYQHKQQAHGARFTFRWPAPVFHALTCNDCHRLDHLARRAALRYDDACEDFFDKPVSPPGG